MTKEIQEALEFAKEQLRKAKLARQTVGNCPSTPPLRGNPVEMFETMQ